VLGGVPGAPFTCRLAIAPGNENMS
jgi:hypothetical protein